MKKIKQLFSFLHDYYVYKKESKSPEFKMVREILNVYHKNQQYIDLCIQSLDHLMVLNKKWEIEKDKEYSEEKYEIFKQVQKWYKRFKENKKKFIEALYQDYYNATGEDILTDIETCLKYLKTSKWYTSAYMDTFLRMKDWAQNSDIHQDMNKLSTYFKDL